MAEKIDYKNLGFKCGLEIHQQLDTRKLFCRCPSLVHDESKADIITIRKLRPVAGETGKIDKAAMHEKMKDKTFLYEACSSSSCLVELDEEPPRPMNRTALKVGLQVAKLLNAKVVDKIYVMRKTVVDGSNVSGFQRTSLIATDGHIDTSLGKVGIPTICLEEEAAQRVSDDKDTTTFRLDRLGVALVEIATDATIKTPEHAKETAEKLGLVLRSTGRVKRGIGSIRQDVNVSIKKGVRVEIKGFQDLSSIPKVIDYEIERQLKLVEEGEKVNEEVRKAEPDFTTSYLRPMAGSARMYPETDCKVVFPKEVEVEDIELMSDRIERIVKDYGLEENLVKIVVKNNIDIERYINKYQKIQPKFFLDYFISYPKELRKRYNVEMNAKQISEFADEVFEKLDKGEIPKEAVIEVLAELGKGKKADYSKFAGVSNDELEAEIKKIVEDEKNKGAPFAALMGMAMAKFRGKVDGKKVSEVLKRLAG